jgi:hypothetical protein
VRRCWYTLKNLTSLNIFTCVICIEKETFGINLSTYIEIAKISTLFMPKKFHDCCVLHVGSHFIFIFKNILIPMSCKVEHGIQKIKCQNALTPQK